jgi:hypothetical protein
VDLPDPLGPVMKHISPALTVKVMSERAQAGF